MDHVDPVSALNRQHNAALPIGKLVDEVVVDVFRTYRTLCFNGNRQELSRYAWLSVTHVCHRWRTLALHTPSMWNTIHTDANSCIVATMLSRSAQSPLTIRPALGRTSALSLLMQELPRIRFLDVMVTHHTLLDVLGACGSVPPSTVLTRLALNLCDETAAVDPAVVLARFGASRLRSFSLQSCTALSPSPFLLPSSLQELSLGQQDAAPWPAARLSALLSALPRLQSLSLDNLIPDAFSPRGTLTLPNLASLSVTDALPRITSFLAWIRAPALRDTALYGSGTPDGSAVLALSQVLRARLRDGGAAPVFARFEYTQDPLAECDAEYIVATLTGGAGAVPAPRLHVDFTLPLEDHDVLPAFIGALPLRTVTQCELNLAGEDADAALLWPDDNYCAWRTAFGALGALEELTIANACWEEWYADEDFLGRNGLRGFFPKLRHLWIG